MGARLRVAAALVALVGVAVASTFPAKGVLPASTCFRVTGLATPLYMAPGACSDQTEAFVAQAWKSPGVLAHLECRASTPFTGVILITGRSGVCGATLTNTTFTCTLTGTGSGIAGCDTGTGELQIAADACWSLGLTFPNGPLSAPQFVNCTMVKAQ